MSKRWPSGHQEEILIEMREKGSTLSQIAEMAGVSYSTATLHLNGILPLEKMVRRLPTYPDEVLHIKGDCALTSDWHSPYFSMKWLKRLLAVCTKMEINQLAIVGDLFDLKWISQYLVRDRRGSLEEEFRITISLLQVLLRFFDRVYWSKGNHDDRILSALQGHDILPVMADLISEKEQGELITTPSSTIFLNERWRLEHPKTYSRDAAKVASSLAAILHRNVACAHGHFIGYKHDVSGKYIGIDLGGIFDRDKQEYLHLGGITTHPRWNPGFWIYRNGKPEPFDDALVNWKEWEIDDNESNINNRRSS